MGVEQDLPALTEKASIAMVGHGISIKKIRIFPWSAMAKRVKTYR